MPLILPHRYIVLASALLSLVGACVIIFSALRFRELSKRFFAIRLIFFLAVTDCFAALFNILGAFVDVDALLRPSGKVPFLCVLQAVGVLYFNLASILWTSCFAFVSASQPTARRPARILGRGARWRRIHAIGTAGCMAALLLRAHPFFPSLPRPSPLLPPSPPPPLSHPLPRHHQTLYRDVVPSYRKHALRGYELYFHLLCWPVPAILAGAATWLGYLGDAGSWCALSLVYTFQYLVCFYLPLLIAFTFNLLTYAAVLAHSRERRVSRITSLYLLGFAVVWLPSLLCRLHVYLSGSKAPPFTLAALEAFCMPLQGALNTGLRLVAARHPRRLPCDAPRDRSP